MDLRPAADLQGHPAGRAGGGGPPPSAGGLQNDDVIVLLLHRRGGAGGQRGAGLWREDGARRLQPPVDLTVGEGVIYSELVEVE